MKLLIKKLLKSILNILFLNRTPLNLSPSQLRDSISELRSDLSKIELTAPLNATASELDWYHNMQRLKYLVLNDDPTHFLQWDVILKTMFTRFPLFAVAELKKLKNNPYWNVRYKPALNESSLGRPTLFPFYNKSSGVLIHHCYVVSQFESEMNVAVDSLDFIIEFGGGYGGMARLFYNLGFKKKYVIFDLPPFSALQKFYLKALGHSILTLENFGTQDSGVLLISDFDHLNKVLSLTKNNEKSLCLATWSLSETPEEIREQFLRLISQVNYHLIAYQHKFAEMNNTVFFDKWEKTQGFNTVRNLPLPHIPGEHSLLLASRI